MKRLMWTMLLVITTACGGSEPAADDDDGGSSSSSNGPGGGGTGGQGGASTVGNTTSGGMPATVAGLCEQTCACESCSVNDCITSGEQVQGAADELGCGAEFDDAITCSHDQGVCNAGNWDVSPCNGLLEQLYACMDAAS